MDIPLGTQLRGELHVGTRVEVHTRYEPGRWAPGFTIADVRPDGYGIRRASDGAVLNETIRADEIRVASPVPSPPIDAHVPERTQYGGLRQSPTDPSIGMDR